MPVLDRVRLDILPRLVEHLNDFVSCRHHQCQSHSALGLVKETLTKRALLKVHQVLLDVRQARRPDDDRVAVLALQQAVVRDPAERDFGEGQPVLGRDGLDLGERGEVGFVPVPAAVRLSDS